MSREISYAEHDQGRPGLVGGGVVGLQADDDGNEARTR
jgi:hypothetical protein